MSEVKRDIFAELMHGMETLLAEKDALPDCPRCKEPRPFASTCRSAFLCRKCKHRWELSE